MTPSLQDGLRLDESIQSERCATAYCDVVTKHALSIAAEYRRRVNPGQAVAELM